MSDLVPGLCECGCGKKTNLMFKSGPALKGRPRRFVRGHQYGGEKPAYTEDPASGCWIWNRARGPLGYGATFFNGRVRRAHRVFYEQRKGIIPVGYELDHLCRTPPCVNPDHLEPVPHAENCRRGGQAKLTKPDVLAIRLLDALGCEQVASAILYGVHPVTIGGIILGRRWKGVSAGMSGMQESAMIDGLLVKVTAIQAKLEERKTELLRELGGA